jgi:hypothetical protein
MNPKAQVFLADQLASLRDCRPLGREKTPEDKGREFSSFTSALQALKAVGAVDESEVQDWTNRCLVALGEEPLPPIEQPLGMRVARLVSFHGGNRPEFVAPPVPEFIRLVPASTAAQVTIRGGRFQVLGVEIYDTELAVAWRLAPLPSDASISARQLDELDVDTEGLPEDTREVMRLDLLRRRRMHAARCEVSDDVGTAYRSLGESSGGGGNARVGRALYAPAPPPESTRLTVLWEDVTHIVPL